jgi:hypothetical protein
VVKDRDLSRSATRRRTSNAFRPGRRRIAKTRTLNELMNIPLELPKRLAVPSRSQERSHQVGDPRCFPVPAEGQLVVPFHARDTQHEVWKFGSPHTLVLTKTDELFRREARARKDATASLEWLAGSGR